MIADHLRFVPAQRRGPVLRRVFEILEPVSAELKAPQHGVCACCGDRYMPKSINQRYCTFRCAKEAERHKRMAKSAKRAIASCAELGKREEQGGPRGPSTLSFAG
jgi:hypothetical protein